MEKFTPLATNFTLPPGLTGWTKSTSAEYSDRLCLLGCLSSNRFAHIQLRPRVQLNVSVFFCLPIYVDGLQPVLNLFQVARTPFLIGMSVCKLFIAWCTYRRFTHSIKIIAPYYIQPLIANYFGRQLLEGKSYAKRLLDILHRSFPSSKLKMLTISQLRPPLQ